MAEKNYEKTKLEILEIVSDLKNNNFKKAQSKTPINLENFFENTKPNIYKSPVEDDEYHISQIHLKSLTSLNEKNKKQNEEDVDKMRQRIQKILDNNLPNDESTSFECEKHNQSQFNNPKIKSQPLNNQEKNKHNIHQISSINVNSLPISQPLSLPSTSTNKIIIGPKITKTNKKFNKEKKDNVNHKQHNIMYQPSNKTNKSSFHFPSELENL